MTRHVFTSALFAGLAAGVLAAMLQFVFVIPFILEGELYETGARLHFAVDGSTQSAAGAPALGFDLNRHGLTVAMNLIAYSGFGLLMVAGFALAERFGHKVTTRQGLLWGLAGFVAVQLAPAAGLPPELPGTIGAEILPRQMWWTSTVAATIGGLAVLAYGRGPLLILCGVALLLVPHLIGAPHLDTYFGVAPPELAAHFVARSLAVGAASWALLGVIAAYFWSRPVVA